MRITIDHSTTYTYAAPSAGIVQSLRMTPRETGAQHILNWRVDIDADGPVRESRDPFGNTVHIFYADGPLSALTLRVRGEVETHDTGGVLGGIDELLPPLVYLRRTRLTQADDAIVDLAYSAADGDRLATLDCLMRRVAGAMRFDVDATDSETTAVDAFERRHGVAQDYAHIFLSAARVLGIPCRYVSGHIARPTGERPDAAHAWVEAFVPDLGWVAFDAANGVRADERHVRVATGLDYLDAAPVRGARRGGGTETMRVKVRVVDRERPGR